MNVKCPNCRFKFDIGIHSNECKENECICPRCGKLISINQLKEVQLTADKDVQTPADAIPQGSEVELFFEAKRLIDEGSYEKALGYVSKLLEISPNEILYLNLKELIDKTDEEKRKSKERVEQMYSSAIHHIETNELELAETLINELQEISPNEPFHEELKTKLSAARQLIAQEEELERLKKEARKQEKVSQQEASSLQDDCLTCDADSNQEQPAPLDELEKRQQEETESRAFTIALVCTAIIIVIIIIIVVMATNN